MSKYQLCKSKLHRPLEKWNLNFHFRKLENAGKQFDSETMTRYNASRDYIALYLAREQ